MSQGSEGEDVAWFAPMGHQVTNGDTKASHGCEEQSQARGLTLFTFIPRAPFPANCTISCHSEPQELETGVSRADPGSPVPSLVPSLLTLSARPRKSTFI